MSIISKCKNCGSDVPKANDILMDFETNQPYRICSEKCRNELVEKEIAEAQADADYGEFCSKAIAKGSAESGKTSASEAEILSWILEAETARQ